MHSILAIAKVTLKDALRKKVLFTVLFFAVILMVSSGLLPWVLPSEQIQQVSKICLGGIGFFGMVVAVFLSAPNLPDDISAKTIFTVMTKPARRWQILAGKILGLGYVLGIMLAVMGSLSYMYIHFWAWKLGPDKDTPGLPRLAGNRYNYAEWVEYGGMRLEIGDAMVESKRAIASGFDRIKYHFEGLDKEQFSGDTVFAEMTLFSHMDVYDKVTHEGTAAIEVANPTTGEATRIVFGGETLRPVVRGFARALVDKTGALDVTVVRHLPTGSYSAMAASVAVLSQPSSYGMNFLKALTMMFVQYMVLVFVATAASTFLTSTVSTITALFIYFTGSFTELLRTQALSLGSGANIFTMSEHAHGEIQEHLTGVVWFANIALRYFYLGISIVFPNFDFYNMSGPISQNLHISGGEVVFGLSYGAVYATLAFAAAWLVFRRKEVA